MKEELRVLVLEDSENDFELIRRELTKSQVNLSIRHVETEQEFRDALCDGPPDVILSDYALPTFDGMTALRLTLLLAPATPFIMVTGSLSEETAVECMKAGATDYVLKDGLLRLGSAVQGALEKKKAHEEKERAEEALRESEERYALAAAGAKDGLWDWNLKTNRVYFSPRWKAMLGYAEEEIGDSPEEWFSRVHPEDLERLRSELEGHLEGTLANFEHEHRVLHKDRAYRWVLSRALAVRDKSNRAYRIAGSQTDITRRKRAEEQLLHDAFHDPLTGLPNRALFLDRLHHTIARTVRQKKPNFAVLFLDLDRFKVVNDSLGHASGDTLLTTVAKRLQTCLRPGDTVARLGGDEFSVLLEDVRDAPEAIRAAERISRELLPSMNLGGHDVSTTASIGIAMGGNPGDRPEDLLRDADTAMYRAKSRGRARHEVFDATMHAHAVSVFQLEAELRQALHRGELRVHYQPIICLESGCLRGFEALVRWHHPERGLLPPGEFIPLAEETGLIVSVDRWVFREACRRLRTWQERPGWNSDLAVTVNLSAGQFSHLDLVEDIQTTLQELGLEARSLRLEITESMIMEDPEAATEKLSELKQLGVGVDIDDFGTGYSSLSHLRRFPIDALKIDRSFVSRMASSSQDLEVVRAIVTLASNLRMTAVAEGIETREQLSLLQGLGCEFGQGFLFSEPTDEDWSIQAEGGVYDVQPLKSESRQARDG